jgi:hypothetical protein
LRPRCPGVNPLSVCIVPLGGQIDQALQGSETRRILAVGEIFFVDGARIVEELEDASFCSLADLN